MSYGQQLTKRYLAMILGHPPCENHRPEWLCGLELDFFYPKLKLGVEFQGDQHFVPTERFGSQIPQSQRDRAKQRLCRENQVTLLRLSADDLRYGRLRSKFRRLNIWMRHGVKHHIRKALEQASAEYRSTLIKNFDSPSARTGAERKLARRRCIEAWRRARGLPLVPVIKPRPKPKLSDIKPVRVLTAADIQAGKTAKGGFTRATIEAWGVPWPPPHKWKKALMAYRPEPQVSETKGA